MRVLFLLQYYKPRSASQHYRGIYLSEYFQSKGDAVTILSSHSEKQLKVEIHNGIEVIYLPVSYNQSMKPMKRIVAFMWFLFKSIIYIFKNRKKFDVIYASSTPLTVGFIALIFKKITGIPYFFELRDLWPEVPHKLGIIRNKIFIKLVSFFEIKTYQNGLGLIALSPPIQDYLIQKKITTPVIVAPNMVDTGLFDGLKTYKKSEHFTITYVGTVGYANYLESFIKLAEHCKNQSEIKFKIIGSGNDLEGIKKIVGEKHLNNIEFIDSVPKIKLFAKLADTDLFYISFLKNDCMNYCSPNKFFDALAMGKPVIVNFKGWINDLITSNKCGIYFDESVPSETFNYINKLKKDPSFYREQCDNAKKLGSGFDKESVLEKIHQFCLNQYSQFHSRVS